MHFKQLLCAVLVSVLAFAVPARAQDFPLTIEHKFGETVIPEKPERVASVDYGGLGNLLALGVQPVTVRQWREMDGFELTAGPWAAPLLETEPVMLAGDIDFEAIAGTDPDVIVALWSGIDAEVYEKLSLIAPVVAVPEGVGDYALSWDERARLTGRAVGEEDAAVEQIEAIRTRIANVRAGHPEWADLTAVVVGFWSDIPGVYTRHGGRGKLMVDLGLDAPQALDALTDDQTFWVETSPEDLSPIDADVVVWYEGQRQMQQIRDFSGRPFLRAHEKGGEVFLPNEVLAAFARVSLLSLPVVIDELVPMLEAAADGDPGTVVPDARQ